MKSDFGQSTRDVIERMMEDYPVFSTKEEFAVRDKYKDSDPEKLKDIMFKHNVGLVFVVVPKFMSKDDDVLQAGMIGLQQAVDRFDWTRKVKFSSFAVPTMKGEVFHLLRPDKVAIRSFSLNTPVYSSQDHSRCEFGDVVDKLIKPEFKRYTVEESTKQLDIKLMCSKINSIVKRRFSARNLRIIHDLYKYGRDNTTLESIGNKYSLTRERIRQIEARYLRVCRMVAVRLGWFRPVKPSKNMNSCLDYLIG